MFEPDHYYGKSMKVDEKNLSLKVVLQREKRVTHAVSKMGVFSLEY